MKEEELESTRDTLHAQNAPAAVELLESSRRWVIWYIVGTTHQVCISLLTHAKTPQACSPRYGKLTCPPCCTIGAVV